MLVWFLFMLQMKLLQVSLSLSLSLRSSFKFEQFDSSCVAIYSFSLWPFLNEEKHCNYFISSLFLYLSNSCGPDQESSTTRNRRVEVFDASQRCNWWSWSWRIFVNAGIRDSECNEWWCSNRIWILDTTMWSCERIEFNFQIEQWFRRSSFSWGR